MAIYEERIDDPVAEFDSIARGFLGWCDHCKSMQSFRRDTDGTTACKLCGNPFDEQDYSEYFQEGNSYNVADIEHQAEQEGRSLTFCKDEPTVGKTTIQIADEDSPEEYFGEFVGDTDNDAFVYHKYSRFADKEIEWMNPVPQRYYRKFETDALGYRLKGVVRYDLEDGFSVDYESYDAQLFDEEEIEALTEHLIATEQKAFRVNMGWEKGEVV